MNPNDQDLTAHVLGELEAEHAEAMASWLTDHPEAQAEAAQLHALATRLTAAAPPMQLRLHPHQREAVLSAPERVRKLVAEAAHSSRRRRSIVIPVLRVMGQFAAAAAIAIIAFVVGKQWSTPSSTQPAVAATKPATPAPTVTKPVIRVFPPQIEVVKKSESAPEPVVPKASPTPAPAVVEPKVIVASAPAMPAPVATTQARSQVFSSELISTTQNAVAMHDIAPAATRPAVGGQPGLAARVRDVAPSAAEAPRKGDLLIHSWKADVASSPWHDGRRLLRVVLQMPSDQATDQSYALRCSFDAATVRSYRKLGTRLITPASADGPAFQIVWFELVPNGSPRSGRILGSVSLPKLRFTTPAMAGFDNGALQIVDQDRPWTEAGDTFQFEAATLGLGLLLKGDAQLGKLNHALVADLAGRTLGQDRDGERAKFMATLKQLEGAAGLVP